MKRLFSIFLMIALTSTLFAGITISGSIDASYRDRILGAIEENSRGRRETDIDVKEFSIGKGSVTIVLTIGDKEKKGTVPPSLLEEEIRSMLFYEEELYLGGEMLEWIKGSSFSFSTQEGYGKGDVLYLYDSDRTVRATFLVDSVSGDVAVLSPVYLSSPLPGMVLEKGSGMRASASLYLGKGGKGAEARMEFLSPLYPFVSYLYAFADTTLYGTKAGAGLGVKARFSLSSFFPSVSTLSNLSVTAFASTGIAFSSVISFDSRWGVGAEYMVTPFWSLSVSSLNTRYGYSVSLGAGRAI